MHALVVEFRIQSQKVTLNLGQWENTGLLESDCSFRLFSNSWDWYKTPAKNLNKFFSGGPWPLRPHSGCASEMYCFEKNAYDVVTTFWATTVIWHRGIVPPCPLRYVSGFMQEKSENFSKINKFSSPNVMNFYSMNICNFRTQYGIGLAQTANKGYWRHFRSLRVVFVSLLCLPHAFFRRGPVFVFLIIKLFRIQQVNFTVR